MDFLGYDVSASSLVRVQIGGWSGDKALTMHVVVVTMKNLRVSFTAENGDNMAELRTFDILSNTIHYVSQSIIFPKTRNSYHIPSVTLPEVATLGAMRLNPCLNTLKFPLKLVDPLDLQSGVLQRRFLF